MAEVSAATVPPVPPHVACRYSALEFASALIRSGSSTVADDRALLRTAIAEADLPDHLRQRLEDAMQGGPATDLTFNAALSPAQQVALLLVGLTVGTGRNDATVRELARTYRITDEAVAYVEKSAAGLPRRSYGSVGAKALSPPDDIVALAGELALRLRLGASLGRPVGHLPPSLYEHPTDRAALRAVREVPGFDTIMKKVSEWSVERQQQIVAVSSKIRVTKKQFPELHALWQIALERAGLPDEPELYVDGSGMNAVTRGVQRKQVILGSSLVSLLDPGELLFSLGHELGHVRSEHVLYRWMTELLPEIMDIIGTMTLGVGMLAASPVKLALLDWYRKSEFTADRFGLLVGQDIEAAGRTLMKVAGTPPSFFRKMDWRAFAAQGREINVDERITDRFWSLVASANETHPWPAVRAAGLLAWAEHGDYERLRTSDPAALRAAFDEAKRQVGGGIPIASGRRCRSCGHGLEPGQIFCDSCGAKQA